MKTKKSRNTMIKLAKQDRAKATIDTILQGATRILLKEGYEGINTNRIAEVAGVSIGSIYQYFSNKEAILGELIERHIKKVMDAFLEKYSLLTNHPLKDGIRILIRAMMEARSVEPRLQRVFDEQLPKVGKLLRLREYEKQAVALISNYLKSKQNELSVKNIEMAAFISVHAVESIILVALNNHLDIKAGGELEDELTNLISRYLISE